MKQIKKRACIIGIIFLLFIVSCNSEKPEADKMNELRINSSNLNDIRDYIDIRGFSIYNNKLLYVKSYHGQVGYRQTETDKKVLVYGDNEIVLSNGTGSLEVDKATQLLPKEVIVQVYDFGTYLGDYENKHRHYLNIFNATLSKKYHSLISYEELLNSTVLFVQGDINGNCVDCDSDYYIIINDSVIEHQDSIKHTSKLRKDYTIDWPLYEINGKWGYIKVLKYDYFNDIRKSLLWIDGVEYGNEYDKVEFPIGINGGLAYVAYVEKDTNGKYPLYKRFIVHNGIELYKDREYDDIGELKNFNGKLTFIARKNTKDFIVMEG